MDIVGVGGRRLHDDWSEVAHAYMGLTVSGFPNFLMLYGPNTNQGGNSIIVILEAQAGYVLSALRAMRRRRASAVDVRREVMDAYNHELAEALAGTIWSDGCDSYFKNARGKIATQLPQTSAGTPTGHAASKCGICPLMKAAVYYETGAPDVFRYEDVPDPLRGPGDILVDVEAVSIEGGDTLNRLGGDLGQVPHIVGYQCAGTVAEVGADVRGVAAGDRVVTVGLDGSHAERRTVPEAFAWRIPDGVPTDQAACVPVPFGTADDCLFEFGRLGRRDGAHPRRCRRSGDRGHSDGEAGRRQSPRRPRRRSPRAPARARPRRGNQGRHRRLRRRGVPLDRRPRCRRRGGRGGAWTCRVDERAGLPGPVRLRRRRRALGHRTSRHLGHAAKQQELSATSWVPSCCCPARHAMIADHLEAIARGELKVVIDRAFPSRTRRARTPTLRARRPSAACCSFPDAGVARCPATRNGSRRGARRRDRGQVRSHGPALCTSRAAQARPCSKGHVDRVPETHYAKADDGVHIAYQVFGGGPFDLVVIQGSSRTSSWPGRTMPSPVPSIGSVRSPASSCSLNVQRHVRLNLSVARHPHPNARN